MKIPQIHPRAALGAKLMLTALPLWIASYLIYLTILGIFGGSDNVGVWFLGGIVLLAQSLGLGLLAFALVNGLWDGPSAVLRLLAHDWNAGNVQARTVDVYAMNAGDGEPFVDEDSPRINMDLGK